MYQKNVIKNVFLFFYFEGIIKTGSVTQTSCGFVELHFFENFCKIKMKLTLNFKTLAFSEIDFIINKIHNFYQSWAAN